MPAEPPSPRERLRRVVLLVGLIGGAAVLVQVASPTPTPAPPAPLELVLEQPPPDHTTAAARVALVGRVEGAPRWADLQVGERSLRVRPGVPFRLNLPLTPGEQTLVLEAEDDAGRRVSLSRRLVRREAPDWFEALPPAQRPPVPLPAGLSPGEQAGEYRHAFDRSILVWVPPGTYQRGWADARPGSDEVPVHEVRLSRGLFLGKLEVTWGQVRCWLEADPLAPLLPSSEEPDDHPVRGISWTAAAAYCAWAGLRLPSEAEWEFAARGEDGRRFPWGDAGEKGNRAGRQDGYEVTGPVGSWPGDRGPFGNLDLGGNVREWVQDWYARYSAGRQVDPGGPGAPPLAPGPVGRVVRGASYGSLGEGARSSDRAFRNPELGYPDVGFRVARDPQ